jgi:hypothetical protein
LNKTLIKMFLPSFLLLLLLGHSHFAGNSRVEEGAAARQRSLNLELNPEHSLKP